MCGIVGVVAPMPGDSAARFEAVRRMVSSLAHRGPDADGVWCGPRTVLGHTRLSIIDLSEAGRQPMVDESGRYVLIFNGEIYNYLELRRELEGMGYRFRSATDSEVVLYAYHRWGPEALRRFNGMWALAIWDTEREELFAARDRAGKKPFHYTIGQNGEFYFASEIRALRCVGLRATLNPQAAFDFLTQGTYGHLGENGFIAEVKQLPPAHWMTLTPGDEPRLTRYWELPYVAPQDRLPYDDAFRARFRDLLTDAVRLRLRSDVPVGATLSGGLDSSTIVALIDRLTDGAPLHIFTSLYPGSRHDETPYFDATVARLRHPLIHRVSDPDADLESDLVQVLDHQEEPFGDTSIVAHFRLMRAARAAGVPVVLSGQGGDELLLGYPSMVHAYLGHLAARGRVWGAVHEAGRWSARSGIARQAVFRGAAAHAIPLGLRDRLRTRYVRQLAEITTPSLRRQVSLRRFAERPGRDSFDSYVEQVFTRFAIPHLTHYDDRNAMTFSVEGRMPFLDYRLVELMFSVQYDALFRDGVTKRVLRESCADLLPEIVRSRGDKVGFHTPLARWLRSSADFIQRLTSRDRLDALDVVEPRVYESRLARLLSGDDSAAIDVWRVFVLHLWADRFDVRPPTASTASAVASPA